MSIQTDLSVSPYFDDYNESKDFYKILFRPGVSVQIRELNQLQTLFQKQIERFGDNIFKSGTIVDGGDIIFHNSLPYVKIKDAETDLTPVVVSNYDGYNIKNQADLIPLTAAIITSVAGFESRAPDLNTMYIRYTNSGFYSNTTGGAIEQTTFAADETLIIYDPSTPLEKIIVNNGASGFSTTDPVVILSAIAIQNTSGGTAFANNFFASDFVSDGTANCQIISIDTTSNTEAVILKIKPRVQDLKTNDAAKWNFSLDTNIQTSNTIPSSIARVVGIVGTGARATLTLGSLGVVSSVNVAQKGSGYYVVPNISIASSSASENQISLSNFTSQNFLTNVTVASAGQSPIGVGYAMTVGEGVVYQKGYFTRITPELVIIEKYANTPDAISVGFVTSEEIINSNQDLSLLDNATGAPNFTAPGANRLKLTPSLVKLTKAEADLREDFLYIAEFSNGEPYKQNRQTVYNKIGNYISQRQYESAGNYVTDPFLLNTKSPITIADEATEFNIFIDPGAAYINGKRIETVNNFEVGVDKGTDFFTAQDATISLNFGNYINIDELEGSFQFTNGSTVDLYNTAGNSISTGTIGAIPSAAGLGTKLGTARIRSLAFDSGIPGTSAAVYRLYLFDIQLNSGANFANVKSVFYDGTNKGIADVVLQNGIAVLNDNNLSKLLYYAGFPAVKKANTISYIYRTMSNGSFNTSGVLTISLATETFPYTGSLSTTQEREVIIVPTVSAEATSNFTGTVTALTTSSEVIGSSTTFASDLRAGDYIKIGTVAVGQVASVTNNTILTLSANSGAAAAANTFKLFFPLGAPISFERSSRTINNNPTDNLLTVNLGLAVNVSTLCDVTHNIRSADTAPVAKTVNRNTYVRINTANNVASNTGPWALGVSDVFRLNKVYIGSNSTFTNTDPAAVDVTQYFYVDHNQNEDYYGISYLVRKPNTPALTLTATDYMLISYDYFSVTEEGMKAPGSSGTYNIDDTITLAASSSSINTLEIPEVYGNKGDYYDLRDQFDFRPYSQGTVTPNTNPVFAPLNPTEPTTRFTTSNKFFPAPDSELSATLEYYLGRTDRVVIDENNEFHVIKGQPGIDKEPSQPDNSLTINLLEIPPYPSLPYQLSAQTILFVDTKVANETYSTKRVNTYRVIAPLTAADRLTLQPRGYTMEEIGKLERRISDLEYYTSFTLTETLAQKRVLPGFDGTDRFKFGFFVDGFEDYRYADVSNPGYKASIVDGYLAPSFSELNFIVESPDGKDLGLPFNEVTFISQTRATNGPIIMAPVVTTPTVVTPTPIVVEPVAPVIVQSIAGIIQQERNTTTRDTTPYVFEEFFYTFSSITGPVEFYINSKNNNIAAEIFQGSTPEGPWTSIKTSADAQAISTIDVATKGLSTLNGSRNIEHPGVIERKSYGPVGNWIEDQFKLLFTHNPSSGIYYKIRIYKGKRNGGFLGTNGGASGTFGYKLFYPTDSDVNIVARTPAINYISTQYQYIGTGGADNYVRGGGSNFITDETRRT